MSMIKAIDPATGKIIYANDGPVGGRVDPTAQKWATVTVKEPLTLTDGTPVTDIATLRTYYYELRKSPSRRDQFEVAEGGVNAYIADILGRPAGVNARDKAFIYAERPFSEVGGYVIKWVYLLRTKPGMWVRYDTATLNSTWSSTGWLAMEDRTPLVVTVDKEGGGSYKADYNSSEILAAAQAHRAVIMRYTDTDTGLQTDVLLKGEQGGLPLFYDTWMSKDGKTLNRIDATVAYDFTVNVTTKTINVATTADIEAVMGTAVARLAEI